MVYAINWDFGLMTDNLNSAKVWVAYIEYDIADKCQVSVF
jgi:hypothetical protein